MAVDHYENFPVASFLLPRSLRPAVKVIYAFARSADDIADEGHATDEMRLTNLRAYEDALDDIEHGRPATSPLFQSLDKVVADYRLPLQPLRDLLSAFKQDVITRRYASYTDLLDYCRRSANPVGCLMLHLYGEATEANLKDANAICTALQLINFWQDLAVDWQKHRVYLPQEDLEQFGVAETQIEEARMNDAFRKLMRFEVDRARALMLSGASLPKRLPGRIGWELRLVVQGGLRILDKIESARYDVFRHRPTLSSLDYGVMLYRSL